MKRADLDLPYVASFLVVPGFPYHPCLQGSPDKRPDPSCAGLDNYL